MLYEKEEVLARDVKIGDVIVEKEGYRYCTISDITFEPGFTFDIFTLCHPEPWANYKLMALARLERLTEQGKLKYMTR